MRSVILVLALAAATPAAAQDYLGMVQARDADAAAQAEAARRRDVELTNQLSRLDAEARTEEGLRTLRALQAPPAPVMVAPPAGAPPFAAPKYAEIPDAKLAASNAAARAASENRR